MKRVACVAWVLRAALAALLIVVVALVVTGCKKPVDYHSAEGRFDVRFPMKPKEQTEMVTTPIGSLALHIVQGEGLADAFTVSYGDYPNGWQNQPVATRLDNVRDGIAKGTASTVTSETPKDQNGCPGREINLDGAKAKMFGRIFICGLRLYQVFWSGPKGNLTDKRVLPFLDSFRMDSSTLLQSASDSASAAPSQSSKAAFSPPIWTDQIYQDVAISLPGEPKTTTRTEKMVGLTANITEHTVVRGDSTYALTVIDVPEASQWDAAASVNGSIDEMLKHVRTSEGIKAVTIISDTKSKIGTMPARRVSATLTTADGTGGALQAMSCSRFTRTYTALALTTKRESDYAEKMIDSFKLAKKSK